MKTKAIAAAFAACTTLCVDAQQSVRVMGEVPGITLAPAPRLEADMTPPPQPAFMTKAVVNVPAIDTSNMAAVSAAYNLYYNVAMPPVGFTGSSAACNPGSVSLAFQEWTISRINFLRAMAGVPGNTTLDSTQNGNEQAAALIMSANNMLSHAPASSMACWTQAGYNGASSSNLSLGVTDAVQIYMSEPGSGNAFVGHRRWLLHSAKSSFGHGQVSDAGNANAMYVFQFGSQASVPNGIAWPPRGYVPLALFPTQFTSVQRWSFGLPGANFAGANVSVTLNGSSVPVNVVSRTDNGYGDNTIVWEMPANHTVTAGTTYTVSITGVSGAASTAYTYSIFPFDAAATPADLVLTLAASPATGVTPGRDVVYTLGVANTGGLPASNTTLTAAMPAGSSFVWASSGCGLAGAVVSCSLGTLAGGAAMQARIVVRPTIAGTLSTTAAVSASPADASTSNNTRTSTITVGAAPVPKAITRYRLYSPVTFEHHYTTDAFEYNYLATVGWQQEGAVGKLLDNPGSYGGVTVGPYYRLYNASAMQHHWTADANEYYIVSQYPGWNGEGIDGFILPTQAPGTLPLHRLVLNTNASPHHWTTDDFENAVLISTYGWKSEGVSGYLIP